MNEAIEVLPNRVADAEVDKPNVAVDENPPEPSPRDFAIAQCLLLGSCPSKAARQAGYAASYAKRDGVRLANSPKVQRAKELLELGTKLPTGTLGNIAKARLYEQLVVLPRSAKYAKELTAAVRTGLETDGMLGGAPFELHLHKHEEMPEAVRQVLAARVRELLKGEDRYAHGAFQEQRSISEVDCLPTHARDSSTETQDGSSGRESAYSETHRIIEKQS